MNDSESLFRLYQDEFQSLREFVSAYSLENRHAGLHSVESTEDPDVMRLLESIAFFAARTHDNALKHVDEFRLRLYQQLFSYLITPLPAFGILKATHSAALTEAVFVERGTEILFRTDTGRQFFFLTRFPFHIHPYSIKNITTAPISQVGFNVTLRFTSRFTQDHLPEQLSLYLDYIGDIQASFAIMGLFRSKLDRVRLRLHGGAHDESDEGCYDLEAPTFGVPKLRLEDVEFLHPMEEERMFFFDPRSELFMHLKMPLIDEPFVSFTIEFDFVERWPRGLVPNVDLFNLHCVPVINIQRATSSPISADGTITRFPILHPDSEAEFDLFKPVGIYKGDKQGSIPLMSSILGDVDGAYELAIEHERLKGRRITHLDLHMPSAFIEPVPVFVDGLWQQPHFTKHRDRPGDFTPYHRMIHGVTWNWQSIPIEHPRAIPFGTASDEILSVLAISHKRFYSYQDLRAILEVYGPLQTGPMKQIYAAFRASRYELRLVQGNHLTAGYVIYFLDFEWEKFDSNNQLFDVFLVHFERVLNHWSAEREIRLALESRSNDNQ